MIIYLLTGLSTILALKNYENTNKHSMLNAKNNDKRIYKNLAIFILTLVFSLRDYSVGTDTYSYFKIFEKLDSEYLWRWSKYEKGFHVVCVIVNTIFKNFNVLLLVLGYIMYWNIVTCFCELSSKPSVSITCYFILRMFAQSCNLLRQYVALSFCLIALCLLIKHNNIYAFLLYVCMGGLFHKSAVIFLIVLPLKYIKFNIKTIVFFVLMSFISAIFLPNIISVFDKILGSGYAGYIDYEITIFNFINISTVCCLVVMLLLLLKLKSIIVNGKNIKIFDLYANIFLMFASIFIISTFSIELVGRIAIYFLPSILFLIPIITDCIKTKIKIEIIELIVFLVLTPLLFYVGGSYDFIPYKSIGIF